MKKALVLGASGGMGYAIVKELVERGVEVIAFARNKNKLTQLFRDISTVKIFSGDVFNFIDLDHATKGVDTLFHAVNIPYPEWKERQPILVKNIIQVAEKNNVKLAVVDNIYSYGKAEKPFVSEDTVKQPHTKKGKIRLELEKMILKAKVPALIAHFPDFYGPNAENTLIHYTLQQVLNNKKASFVGSKKVAREYIFTPDGAKAIVELAFRNDAYGEQWNIPAHSTISGEEIEALIKQLTGYKKNFFTVTKGMIRILGLFSREMREFTEMMYLTEQPVVLSGEKYESFIGPIPRTSYKEGLKQTINFIRENGS